MEHNKLVKRCLWFTIILVTLPRVYPAEKTICVRQRSETNVLIHSGMEAGNFVSLGRVVDITECLNKACDSQKGNIAFLLEQICFSVICHNIQSCKLEAGDTDGKKTAGALYQVIAAYPKFQNLKDMNYIGENKPPGTEVASLNVVAESRKKDMETMSFEIVKGNMHNSFLLYPKFSNHRVTIRTTRSLDRETLSSYQLTIRATNTVENVSTSVDIAVGVLDTNDNPPQFTKTQFVFNVFSNMSLQTIIGRVMAKDKDSGQNGALSYSITPIPDFFTLDQNTGDTRLIKLLRVDSVQTKQYQLLVTDGRYTTNGKLQVDVYPNNVNRPVFKKHSYNAQLNGQTQIGTEIVRVSASDPDFGKLGELKFVILKGNEDNVFSITSEGAIKTIGEFPLLREQYNLTVQVHDNGYPQLYAAKPVNVVISLLWLHFKQDLYETAILEDHAVSHKVITVSATLWVGGVQLQAGHRKRRTDGTNYYLEGGADVLDMDEMTGVITLTQPLDYETKKLYELVLRADCESADSLTGRTLLTANAVLRLHVMDVNDNPPRFSHIFYSQDVWRSSKINSPILKINATDNDGGRNGKIRYVAGSGNVNNTFSFHNDGMVFLRKSLETIPVTTFNISVVAWDNGAPKPLRSPNTAWATIHVHDYSQRLVFEKNSYSASVMENGGVGRRLVRVRANGAKQTKVTYEMRVSSEKIPFEVDPRSGWITNTGKLDREVKEQYVIRVIASTDIDRMSVTTFVDVTIKLKDMNDNYPVFTQEDYSATMTSDQVGADILKIEATDKDAGNNARISYEISGGKDKDYFVINPRTGQVRNRRVLPTKSLVVLKFFVSAKDEGTPSYSSKKPVPVYVLVSNTFPIIVLSLGRTTTEITLRFTMINVTLHDVEYIGIVAQEVGSIAEFDEISKRPFVSWFYIRNGKGNGLYAQRYLTGKVKCTDTMRKTKIFEFTVGSDGKKCESDKRMFCNGRLQAEKGYRFQLVAYFKNGTSPKNISFVESEISEAIGTKMTQGNQIAGYRSWRYDIIVIILGIALGIIIIATITRAIMLYRKDKERMKKEDTKDGISYPLSNPRFRKSGEHSASSRSTISFTELSKSRKTKPDEKTSPCESEKLGDRGEDTEEEEEEEEHEEEEASDKEMETELN